MIDAQNASVLIFKDGDTVEIDANRGIIKKIS